MTVVRTKEAMINEKGHPLEEHNSVFIMPPKFKTIIWATTGHNPFQHKELLDLLKYIYITFITFIPTYIYRYSRTHILKHICNNHN